MRRSAPVTTPQPRGVAPTSLTIVVSVLAALPMWIVCRPPLEDWPLHLSTTRVVHSLHDPRFGLDADFVLTLGRTQYVSYYLLGSVLAYVVGVSIANRLLASIYLAGSVWAMRWLIRSLGGDERASLLLVPLLYGPLFGLGLLPFLLGIPVLFCALAAFLDHVERPTFARGALAAMLATLLFFVHVVPFGLLGVGVAAAFPYRDRRRWLASIAVVVPAAVAALAWIARSDSGHQLLDAIASPSRSNRASPLEALAALPPWIFDLFTDSSDGVIAALLMALAIVAVALTRRAPIDRRLMRYTALPLSCLVLYFVTSRSNGFMWPVAERFPSLCAITAIPLIRFPQGRAGAASAVAAALLAVVASVNVAVHFVAFERDEVGDLDGALAAMEPRKHVAALIFDRGSQLVHCNPFLHFGAYYQLDKGGVVQFSFAGYNHWPTDYRPGHYPPPGGPARPRWEWSPEQVTIDELAPYYDYVLTRGEGFHPPEGTFHLAFQGARWQVWERDAK